MVFGRFKKPKSSEAFGRHMSFVTERIEKTENFIANAKEKADTKLVLMNYAFLIGHLADRSVLAWRQGQDPQSDLEEMYIAYSEATRIRIEEDPDSQLQMSEISANNDWDRVYTLFWLFGKNVKPHYHHEGFPENRYFFYSRYLLSEILNTDVNLKNLDDALLLCDRNQDLVDKNFLTKLKLLRKVDHSESISSLVEQAEQDWIKRTRSSYYRSNAPDMAGVDETNKLSLDHTLSAILKKIQWSGDSVHKWHWS